VKWGSEQEEEEDDDELSFSEQMVIFSASWLVFKPVRFTYLGRLRLLPDWDLPERASSSFCRSSAFSCLSRALSSLRLALSLRSDSLSFLSLVTSSLVSLNFSHCISVSIRFRSLAVWAAILFFNFRLAVFSSGLKSANLRRFLRIPGPGGSSNKPWAYLGSNSPILA